MWDEEGFPWRLFPYISNTITIENVTSELEAYEAAKGFATLTKNLDGVDVNKFKASIEKFQNLSWRFEQLEDAIRNASDDRKIEAEQAIEQALSYSYLVKEYRQLISSKKLKTRIVNLFQTIR